MFPLVCLVYLSPQLFINCIRTYTNSLLINQFFYASLRIGNITISKNYKMVDAITAIVVSAILFGGFVILWILSIVFCLCNESLDGKSSHTATDRRFTPEEEQMIRRNSERIAQNYREGIADL